MDNQSANPLQPQPQQPEPLPEITPVFSSAPSVPLSPAVALNNPQPTAAEPQLPPQPAFPSTPTPNPVVSEAPATVFVSQPASVPAPVTNPTPEAVSAAAPVVVGGFDAPIAQPTLSQPSVVTSPQSQPGAPQAAQPIAPALPEAGSKSFLVAFLLSLFLGSLGIDRFYLGKIGTGILKLVTFGGLGIWSTIDFILILANHTKAKDGTALQGYREHRKIAFIVVAVWVVVWIGFGAIDVLALHKVASSLPASSSK